MKKIVLLLGLSTVGLSLFAQVGAVEAEIRALEQRERQAVLDKDTATLRALWAEDLTVNAPINRVVQGGGNTLDRPVITQFGYSSFERTVEEVLVRGSVAISMGSEVVVPTGGDAAGRAVNRRYTNIWQKGPEGWRLMARHANVVCGSQ